MAKWSRTIPAPSQGAFPDLLNPRTIPPDGAARLLNVRRGDGFVQSRPGTSFLTLYGPVDDAGLKTGTITVTKGNVSVVGVGTLFTTEYAVGAFIKVDGQDDTTWTKIASIASNTALTLTTGYRGASVGGAGNRRGNLHPNPAIDIHNVAFGDGTVETFYHTKTKTFRYFSGSWVSVAGVTWTGTDTDRFWTLLVPFGATTKGRILFNNGIDAIQVWDGSAATALGASAIPARYAIVGDDNRLITADTLEGGERRRQRIRWTTVALTQGDHTAWTAIGSGTLEIRNDGYPITALFKTAGRAWIGKLRSMAFLAPTGIDTDAYGFETLTSGIGAGADGVFASRSLSQYGEVVGYLSPRTILLFAGGTYRDILGRRARKALFRRLNTGALDAVTAVIDPDNNRVGWGLPLDGSPTPTEIWWYDVERDGWDMDTIPHRALSVFTNVAAVTVDQLAGTVDSLVGAVDSLSPVSGLQTKVIFGTVSGDVFFLDDTVDVDQYTGGPTTIPMLYESPAVSLAGGLESGSQKGPSPSDKLGLDETVLWMGDFGASYSLAVSASSDGGRTYKSVGNISLTTGGGTLTAPRLVEARLHSRLDVGKQCQIRLSPVNSVRSGWSELTLTFDVAGTRAGKLAASVGVGGGAGGAGGGAGGGGGRGGGGGGGPVLPPD